MERQTKFYANDAIFPATEELTPASGPKITPPSCLRIGRGCDSFYRNNVRLSQKNRKWFKRTAKTVLSLVLLLQMIGLLVLAASPALHHALHPDSNHCDHGCIVTLFIKGQLCGTEVTPIITVFAAFLIYAVLLPDARPRLLFQYRFDASRAPPQY
jgi:hypothetical protein